MRQLNFPLSAANTHLSQISSTAHPTLATKYENVLVYNNRAYLSTGVSTATLVSYDITNPATPQLLTTNAGGGTYGAAIQGNYLYYGGSGSTFVYSFNLYPQLANISALNLTAIAGACYQVAPYGNYLYVATQNKGLTVVNIANPAAMTQGFQEGGTTNKSFGVCIGPANTVYTTSYDSVSTHVIKQLKTWDITNPALPVLTNNYTFAANVQPGTVSYWNKYCFVGDLKNNTIMIVDVSNPSAPTQISTLTLSAGVLPGVKVSINTQVPGKVYAYVGSGANATKGAAIDFFDITNPAAPVLVSTTWNNIANSTGGPTFLSGNNLYVANYGVAPGNSTMDIYTSTTGYSAAVTATNLFDASTLLNVSDSSSYAEIALQASDDPTNPSNWSTVSSTVRTVTNTNGLVLVPKTNLSYEYIRLAYSTLGNGSTVGTLKALGE